MTKKWVIIIISAVVFAILLTWLFVESSKPLPGDKALQDGRNHIPEGSKTDFKFNPPTSGDHYPSWITKGFYDEPRPDGNLVHSQEHGYVIFWYDCGKKVTVNRLQWTVGTVYAQGIGMTAGSQGSPSAFLKDMPKSFSDGSCDSLKNQIKDVMNKNKLHKLIAVPRVNLDYPLILTAWGRMERLNSVDQGKIKEFINAFRDAGPEATVEP